MNRRYRRDIPPCKAGGNHAWKKGAGLFQETGICAKCGYDQFDQVYRKLDLREGEGKMKEFIDLTFNPEKEKKDSEAGR